jgi:hypothetical protein
MITAMAAPDTTRSGRVDIITTVRSHPFVNAITKPPMNVAISCKNFPTCFFKNTIKLSLVKIIFKLLWYTDTSN